MLLHTCSLVLYDLINKITVSNFMWDRDSELWLGGHGGTDRLLGERVARPTATRHAAGNTERKILLFEIH